MTEQPDHQPGPLTATQATRVEFARRDLDYARSEDLVQLDPAALILMIEQLRRRLDETLQVIDEITSGDPSSKT